MPQSLEKHTRICEQSTSKKRKPFDSAKQRIQGTELAEFRPRQEKRRHGQDDRASASTWKQTHDDFLRAIRAARNEIVSSGLRVLRVDWLQGRGIKAAARAAKYSKHSNTSNSNRVKFGIF